MYVLLGLCWQCCCSDTKSCLTLCNPLDCNTPGVPVLYHLLECVFHALLQGILNVGLLHCRQLLCLLSHQGNLENRCEGCKITRLCLRLSCLQEQWRVTRELRTPRSNWTESCPGGWAWAGLWAWGGASLVVSQVPLRLCSRCCCPLRIHTQGAISMQQR